MFFTDVRSISKSNDLTSLSFVDDEGLPPRHGVEDLELGARDRIVCRDHDVRLQARRLALLARVVQLVLGNDFARCRQLPL